MSHTQKNTFRKKVDSKPAASRAQSELAGEAKKSHATAPAARDQSDLAGPGRSRKRRSRQGKGHKDKVQRKARKKWLAKVQLKRANDLRSRHSSSCGGGGPSAGPKISVLKNSSLDGMSAVSGDLMENFYFLHPRENCWLEVSEGPNVSNPHGVQNRGKGVFAKRDIPIGTRLCPYVGSYRNAPCPRSENCEYDLRVTQGFCICARESLYDIGYLQTGARDDSGKGLRDHSFIKMDLPSPPNYGRYFNTARGKSTTNCAFEIACDGHDVMYIYSTHAVAAGEELLVDYGDSFTIADEVSDAGTESASDGDEF